MEDEFHPSAPDSPSTASSRESGSSASSSSSTGSSSSTTEPRPLAISEPVLVSATNVSQLPGVSMLQEQLKQQQAQRSKSPTVHPTAPCTSPATSSASPQRITNHLAPPSSYMRRQTSSPSLSNNDTRQMSPQPRVYPVPQVPTGYSTLRPTRPSASPSPTPLPVTPAPTPTAGESRSPVGVSPAVTRTAALSNYNRPPSNSSPVAPVAPAQMVLEGLAAPSPARLRRQSMTLAKMSSEEQQQQQGSIDDDNELPSYLRPHARTLMQPDPRRLSSTSPIDMSQRTSTTVHVDRTRRMQTASASSTSAATTSTSMGSPDKSS
jgi:hypothetical protein